MSGLFLCVDAGGTKTACAISSPSGQIIHRGYSGCGNLAELGVELCFRRIAECILDALGSRTLNGSSSTRPTQQMVEDQGKKLRLLPEFCPVVFENCWIGISGCDSKTDSRVISEPLSRWLQQPVTAMNDALLLSSSILIPSSTPSTSSIPTPEPPSFDSNSPIPLTRDSIPNGHNQSSQSTTSQKLISSQMKSENFEQQVPWGLDVVVGTGSVVCGVKLSKDENEDVTTSLESHFISSNTNLHFHSNPHVDHLSKSNPTPQLFARLGGHGYLLSGDPGSSYHLGQVGCVVVVNEWGMGMEEEEEQEEDLGNASGLNGEGEEEINGGIRKNSLKSGKGQLVKAIREGFGVARTEDIPAVAHALDPTLDPTSASTLRKLRISNLARPIIDCARAHPPDPLALRVLAQCASALADDITRVTQAGLDRLGGRVDEVTLSFTGGLIAQEVYRREVLEQLRMRGVVFGRVVMVVDAAGDGARALALDAGKNETREITEEQEVKGR